MICDMQLDKQQGGGRRRQSIDQSVMVICSCSLVEGQSQGVNSQCSSCNLDCIITHVDQKEHR